MKKYMKKKSAVFFGAIISILLSTVFAVSLQFIKGDVLDYAVAGDLILVNKYIWLLFVFIISEILLFFIYKLLSAKFIVGCSKELKNDIFSSIMSHSYVDYKKSNQGSYIAKYANEADTIVSRYFALIPLFYEIFFKICIVSLALFLLDWRVAVITLFLLTTPLYLPKLIEKKLQKIQEEQIKAVSESIEKINDWLSGFEIIKNFSIEKKIMGKFEVVNDNSAKKFYADIRIGALSQLITTLISYLSYFIILACSAVLVWKGEFSAGEFFVAIGMVDQLSYPLISLADIIRELIAIKPICRKMETFIIKKEKVPYGRKKMELQQQIIVEDVSFSYPEQPLVFEKLNFVFEKNRRYLIKGPSGCGKTTMINLLLQYYPPITGNIKIDNTPIEQYDSSYDLMTVVRQEAILFHDSLRNNLTMYQNFDEDIIIKKLVELGLEKYANKDSLDEIVEENGSNFSGGEQKRICLARALLRKTDVLILDEPLANLDIETGKKIEDLLLQITDRTVIIVSHQFTNEKIGLFDNVFNLDASIGKV
ncbi:MAG: ABC transporter ATP-binding protein [Lachnospiraceae bacterium]